MGREPHSKTGSKVERSEIADNVPSDGGGRGLGPAGQADSVTRGAGQARGDGVMRTVANWSAQAPVEGQQPRSPPAGPAHARMRAQILNRVRGGFYYSKFPEF